MLLHNKNGSLREALNIEATKNPVIPSIFPNILMTRDGKIMKVKKSAANATIKMEYRMAKFVTDWKYR